MAIWQPRMIVKNLLRNRRPTLLTAASVRAFFFLFTILIATCTFIRAPAGGAPHAAHVNIAQALRFVGSEKVHSCGDCC
jgi:hypothetical protein